MKFICFSSFYAISAHNSLWNLNIVVKAQYYWIQSLKRRTKVYYQQLKDFTSKGTGKKSSLLKSPLTAWSLRAHDSAALGDSKKLISEKKWACWPKRDALSPIPPALTGTGDWTALSATFTRSLLLCITGVTEREVVYGTCSNSCAKSSNMTLLLWRLPKVSSLLLGVLGLFSISLVMHIYLSWYWMGFWIFCYLGADLAILWTDRNDLTRFKSGRWNVVIILGPFLV